jgi:23S rRNA pseudouridine1911/1915/1917 synthase
MLKHSVPHELNGIRLDKALSLLLENVSRSQIQKAIKSSCVQVNDVIISDSDILVKENDVILFSFKEPEELKIAAANIALDIIYEDDDVILVNKAAGMVVHPGFNNYTGTLVNALVYHAQQLPQMPGNEGRPGLVHRIDKDTSGLLLVSKNEWAITFLAKQFFDHSITRKYLALVWGDLKQDGTVKGYIGRSLKDRKVMAVYDDEDKGKWSVTHYKILERLNYVTLIECELETGRTHQIRAHMKHIGHPLFNDSSYGGDRILKGTIFNKYRQFVENGFELMPRQALHAKSLGFIHPGTRKFVHFETELPADFTAVLEKWRTYIKE